MSEKANIERDKRRNDLRARFSNYENAVNLISSLEAWLEYRWGPKGKEGAGLLKSFNRFPNVDDLTPDFEATFNTPYTIWGDHKRTIRSTATGTHDTDQIIKYAMRAEDYTSGKISHNYDVVVLVSTENDDIAAEAINDARDKKVNKARSKKSTLAIAPIIVLGCHLDRESVNGEWYKIKWRNHHKNCRFSTPNISSNATTKDLNGLLINSTHHAIPVSKPALGLSSRSPFINDDPPPIFTAVRLITPAVNSILNEEERDQLQSNGRIEKTVSKDDILNSDIVKAMNPQPSRLGKWIEAGLEFLATELRCAKKVGQELPQQYQITIDNILIKGDLKELFSGKAAKIAARKSGKKNPSSKYRGDSKAQLDLF